MAVLETDPDDESSSLVPRVRSLRPVEHGDQLAVGLGCRVGVARSVYAPRAHMNLGEAHIANDPDDLTPWAISSVIILPSEDHSRNPTLCVAGQVDLLW